MHIATRHPARYDSDTTRSVPPCTPAPSRARRRSHPSSDKARPHPIVTAMAPVCSKPPSRTPSCLATIRQFPRNARANPTGSSQDRPDLPASMPAAAYTTIAAVYAQKNMRPNALPAPWDSPICCRKVLEIIRGKISPHTAPYPVAASGPTCVGMDGGTSLSAIPAPLLRDIREIIAGRAVRGKRGAATRGHGTKNARKDRQVPENGRSPDFLGGVYDFMIMIFRSRRPSAQARGRRPGVLLPGDGSPALRRAGGAALSPPSGRPGRTLRRKKLADTALPVTRRGTGAGAAATWPLSRPTTRPPGRRPEAPAGRIPRFAPEFVIRLLGNSSSYRLDCNPRKPHSENP